MDEVVKLVLFHDVDGDELDRDLHVLVLFHRRVEVEVLDVDGNVFCIGRGEDAAVEVRFDGGVVSSRSGDFAEVYNFVPINRETDAVHFGFVGFEGSNKT